MTVSTREGFSGDRLKTPLSWAYAHAWWQPRGSAPRFGAVRLTVSKGPFWCGPFSCCHEKARSAAGVRTGAYRFGAPRSVILRSAQHGRPRARGPHARGNRWKVSTGWSTPRPWAAPFPACTAPVRAGPFCGSAQHGRPAPVGRTLRGQRRGPPGCTPSGPLCRRPARDTCGRLLSGGAVRPLLVVAEQDVHVRHPRPVRPGPQILPQRRPAPALRAVRHRARRGPPEQALNMGGHGRVSG